MAVSQIYLQGGPCDGKTVSADQIVGGLTAYIACGGGYYIDTGTVRPDGKHVWRYSGKTPPKPPGPAGTPHTHKGWADLRHSVNVNMRKDLTHAQHLTASALRSLSRSRKVRL